MVRIEDHIVEVGRDSVEYRLPTANGCRVVKVFLMGAEPRVMFFSQAGPADLTPTSLYVSELAEYINDAQKRLGRS